MYQEGIQALKELMNKIIFTLPTVAFWAFTLFVLVVWAIICSVLFGGGTLSNIVTFIGSGVYGWFIINPRLNQE